MRRLPGPTLRNLPCKTVQVDEMWGFCYAKQKNVPDEHKGTSATATYGPGPRFVRIRSWSRRGWSGSVPSATAGRSSRTSGTACATVSSSAPTATRRIAARSAWSSGATSTGRSSTSTTEPSHGRGPLQPAGLHRDDQAVRLGDPDPAKISTSYIERQNLTDPYGNAPVHTAYQRVLKEGREPAAAVSLHYMHYNFAAPTTR